MSPTSPEAGANQVDGLFALWSQEGMPGAAVGVFQAGEVLYQQGYGLADLETGERIRSDGTAFLLASVTKPFTAGLPLLSASKSGPEARYQVPNFVHGVQDYVCRAVYIQDQPRPQAVRPFQAIRPLEDHTRLVV